MNFTKFIDCRFQELRLETEGKDEFDAVKDSELKAVHQLLTYYRSCLKWLFMPKVMMDFISVKLGIKSPPQPVLVNMIKEQKEREAEALRLKKEAEQIIDQLVTDVEKPFTTSTVTA